MKSIGIEPDIRKQIFVLDKKQICFKRYVTP